MIRDALKEHDENKLSRYIDRTCEQIVRALCTEAQIRAINNVCTPIYPQIYETHCHQCFLH